jgi:hypothetical protein
MCPEIHVAACSGYTRPGPDALVASSFHNKQQAWRFPSFVGAGFWSKWARLRKWMKGPTVSSLWDIETPLVLLPLFFLCFYQDVLSLHILTFMRYTPPHIPQSLRHGIEFFSPMDMYVFYHVFIILARCGHIHTEVLWDRVFHPHALNS